MLQNKSYDEQCKGFGSLDLIHTPYRVSHILYPISKEFLIASHALYMDISTLHVNRALRL